MSHQKNCSHQWTQHAPFIPNWVRGTPSPKVCPQPIPPVSPNPTFPSNAILQMCTPLQFEKSGPNSVVVTVSIPAESVITLPTKALEIKLIKKNLKITQSHFLNCVPSEPGIPHDTPKLFLEGFVRKDIQYSEAVHQTSTTVSGVMKDFLVDIPISCVIDLGKHLIFPPIYYDQQKEYGFANSITLPSGCLSNNLPEFNLLSRQFYNQSPACQLLFSQINEMDHALDRLPLQGGPLEECTFTTLQEKMIILIQLRLTFPTQINYPDDPCSCHPKKDKCSDLNLLFNKISTILAKLNRIIKGPHVALLLLQNKHFL
ncbi:CsxC family protein [Desulfosporosinus youngiae]|uniref:SipL SPOCS domain-containing protein n=1 Tax=Desulfosporosinus youngiae DSM 17734 TaxID=768710 RepID=H5Y1E1_9FIRM|nr:hypothetical protein [Desulfosporosinus youngiae]EHQ87554.1 hypothetical protein DesyoDRAFT_0360 [Desulfosporosinus youngiae DSM 17734]